MYKISFFLIRIKLTGILIVSRVFISLIFIFAVADSASFPYFLSILSNLLYLCQLMESLHLFYLQKFFLSATQVIKAVILSGASAGSDIVLTVEAESPCCDPTPMFLLHGVSGSHKLFSALIQNFIFNFN